MVILSHVNEDPSWTPVLPKSPPPFSRDDDRRSRAKNLNDAIALVIETQTEVALHKAGAAARVKTILIGAA